MTDAPETPFKGLASFDATDLDALLFFGRERERELIVGNLLASRLTVLYGPSGVGKSSLLRAGVAHRLRQEVGLDGRPEYRVVVFDSWSGDPWSALATELSRGEDGRDLLLLLDQTEEYFVYHAREEGPGTFVGELPLLVTDPKLRVNVLLAIREDALARLDRFKGSIPSLFSNYLRLDHLDRDAARAAIVGPVERYNRLAGKEIQVEDALVDAVLDETVVGRVDLGTGGAGRIAGEEGGRVEAPYLQLVLRRLWDAERAEGSDILRLSTLQRLGGAEAIVRAHLERALSELDAHERDLAASVFRHLVTPSGAKIAHAVGDLAQYADVDEDDLRPVVTRLVEERILRPAGPGRGGADGVPHEIFHDVLANAVLAWRSRHETEQRVATERARHRRALRLVGVALVGLLAMTAVAVYAVLQRSDARDAARQAQARELAARSLSAIAEAPQESLRLALAAAQLERTPQTEDVLRRALGQARLRRVIRLGGPVAAVHYLPAGRVLAAQTDRVTMLDTRTGRVLATLRVPDDMTSVDVAPNGAVLAAAGRLVRVRMPDGRVIVLRHRAVVTSAVFGNRGKLVVSGARDGGVRVWRTTGKLLRTLRGPRAVRGVVISPDGGRIATVAADSQGHVKARLYDARTGRLLRTLPQLGVETLSFDPSGARLVTGGADDSARISRANDGGILHTLDHGGNVSDAAFSADGSLLATASRDNVARVWTVATGAKELQLLGHSSGLNAIAYAPSGEYVVSGGDDREARVWTAPTPEGMEGGAQAALLAGHTGPVRGLAVAPDSRSVATSSDDGTVRIWDGQVEQQLIVARRSRARAVGFLGGRPVGLPARTDAVRALGRLHGRSRTNATVAAVSPDGELIAAGYKDGTVRIYTARGESVGTLEESHPGAVTDVRFDPSGLRLVTASAGPHDNVFLWDVRTRSRIAVLIGHGSTVSAASFSPDGRWIATAGPIAVAIWRTGSADPLFYLRGHTGLITDAEWAPAGYRIATVARDGTLRTYTCEVCVPIEGLMTLARQRLDVAR